MKFRVFRSIQQLDNRSKTVSSRLRLFRHWVIAESDDTKAPGLDLMGSEASFTRSQFRRCISAKDASVIVNGLREQGASTDSYL
jgi:hypothetical protein